MEREYMLTKILKNNVFLKKEEGTEEKNLKEKRNSLKRKISFD